MTFWWSMLVMSLLIPLIMIVFGSFFIKSAPRKINFFFGYRTSMSMKNRETWAFAHTYCGKLWRSIGLVMLPLSVALMLFVYGKEIVTIGIFGAIITMVQLPIIIVTIVFTEIALHKHFDEAGNRIDEVIF